MTKDEYAEISNLKKLVGVQDQEIKSLKNLMRQVTIELNGIKREMIKNRSNKDWNDRR